MVRMLDDWKDRLVLLRYGLASYGIAAINWVLSPGILSAIFPSLKGTTAFDRPWIATICILPLVWIFVVVVGIKKIGRWGLLLLVCTDNLNPGVAVMKSAQDGA
jgi:hypothetical protein